MCLSRVDVLGVGSFTLWCCWGCPWSVAVIQAHGVGSRWSSDSHRAAVRRGFRGNDWVCQISFHVVFRFFFNSKAATWFWATRPAVCPPRTVTGVSGKTSRVVFGRPWLSHCPRSHPVWFITVSSVMPERDPHKQLPRRFVWANDWSSEDWDGVYS